jgi:hypothetical protein
MKNSLVVKTTVCAAIGAMIGAPGISLAANANYPPKRQLVAQRVENVHDCKSSFLHSTVGKTLGGAALGAVGGALTGNAGQGALIGGGVGAASTAVGKHSHNVGLGALEGGAVGALGGAITGNAGRGAAVGAGVGAASRAIGGPNHCDS